MQVRSPAEVRQTVAALVVAAATLAQNACITNGGDVSVSVINTVTNPGFPI